MNIRDQLLEAAESYDAAGLDGECGADMCRAAVAALIAAEEMADAAEAIIALEDNTSPFGGELQADRIERTHDRFIASIAAYRSATGAA